jgi:hypothetical protein
MELPKIDLPTYEFTVPSLGKKYTFRPFTVKEERILLIASESKDIGEIIRSVLQVVGNCCLDPELNIAKLPYFDIDYLFIALRAKSIGEKIELKFSCNETFNGDKCGNVFPVSLDITNIATVYPEVPDKVELVQNKGVKLKYPDYAGMKMAATMTNPMDAKLHLIAACVEYIYDKDQIFKAKDFTTEELLKFLEGMSEGSLRKVETWISNFPTFHVVASETCSKCGFHHTIKYDKFHTFFLR